MQYAIRFVQHFSRNSSSTGFIGTIDLYAKEQPWSPWMVSLCYYKPVFRYGYDFNPDLRCFRGHKQVENLLKMGASLDFDTLLGKVGPESFLVGTKVVEEEPNYRVNFLATMHWGSHAPTNGPLNTQLAITTAPAQSFKE